MWEWADKAKEGSGARKDLELAARCIEERMAQDAAWAEEVKPLVERAQAADGGPMAALREVLDLPREMPYEQVIERATAAVTALAGILTEMEADHD